MHNYAPKESSHEVNNNASTVSSWSTLPKRIISQMKHSDNSQDNADEVYNIENGALSIRKRDFPQLEVTIGSRTLERNNRGKNSNSVVLEPLGKSDHLDIGEGLYFESL